uniref:Uncharacterized protein n=1 Tax=Cacopsylla melanoneura TaxID=428564 RepID=A0A8D9AU62_9HEMI
MEARLQSIEDNLTAFGVALEAAKSDSAATVAPNNPLALLETSFNLFRSQVSEELKHIKVELSSHGTYLDRQETYSRRNCVLLHGVPEADAGTEEQCEAAALRVFADKLQVMVTSDQIDRSHRLGPKRGPAARPRPIIIKFISYKTKKLVYTNKKKLKDTHLLISESLTKLRMEILKTARESFEGRNVWTSDGKIIVKQETGQGTKFVSLTTKLELTDLLAQTRLDVSRFSGSQQLISGVTYQRGGGTTSHT